MPDSRPSLLILASELPPGPGGIGTHAHQLARHLDELEWRVHVVAYQDYASDDEIRAWTLRQPFTVHRLRRGRMPAVGGFVGHLRNAWKIRRLVRTIDPDVCIASGRSMLWLCRLFRGRIPWLAVAHGFDVTTPGLRGWLARRSLGHASTVVAVSGFTAGLVRRSDVEPRRLEVIHNGADETAFRPLRGAERDAFHQRHSERVDGRRWLVTVGRVCERKGQDLVVRALARLKDEYPNLHYAAIGLPDVSLDLESLALELEVGGRVHRMGRLPSDDVRGFLDLAELFVLPSRQSRDGDVEGFGIAAVEAALCGTPAVVTSGSGLAEAVEDGVTGWLVPPEDVEALAVRLQRCLADPEATRAVGEEAEERARRGKTWRQRVVRYDEVLRQLTEAN